MDIIKMARDLGSAVQETEEYKKAVAAKDKNDADEGLQGLIANFNEIRGKLSIEMQNKDEEQNHTNPDAIKELDSELKALYEKIMTHELMLEFNEAKDEIDSIMNQISNILLASVNGEDPQTFEVAAPAAAGGGCGGGGCSSCSGCH